MHKAIVYICITVFALAGCQEPDVVKSISPKKQKVWNISSWSVQSTQMPINYKSIGTVVSDQRIDVSSRATGYIKNIFALEGDKVFKGQVLIALDDADVEGAILQAEASINTAKLAVHDADIDVERYKDLFKKGSVSENLMRKTQLFRDRANDALDTAKTTLSIAQSQRQYIKMSSEVDGIVVKRHLRKGDLATPGKPILTIESSQGLFFDTYVAESQISNIRKGVSVAVFIDALNKKIDGIIARVVPAGDSTTRRYKIKIALSNDEGLLSGMFGRVNFILGEKSAVIIPASALVERGGLQGVFVINDQQEAYFRWLNLGAETKKGIEVRAGLVTNEKIILQGNSQIREGDIVKHSAILETVNE